MLSERRINFHVCSGYEIYLRKSPPTLQYTSVETFFHFTKENQVFAGRRSEMATKPMVEVEIYYAYVYEL